MWRRGCWSPDSSGPRSGWWCWPRQIWPARGRGRGSRIACRAAAAAGSTRCSCARRLHRARTARRRPVPRDDQPDRAGRDQGLPGDRVRAEQARPAAGPAVPADRPARRGDQVHRRRGSGAAPARRCRLGEGQGPGAQGGPGHRGRPDPAVPGAGWPHRGTRSAPTRPGSASSRTPSLTWRRRISSPPLTRSRPTWSEPFRWTG